ncbi:MAG: outer membrane beta-barrel protein [Capnocytophaga sp.]|nr:outer membrane beta-barrel protein [Capnocytophaga sp.]
MKQFMLLGAIIIAFGSMQAQTKAGIHFGYGTEIKKAGLGVNAEFGITDKIAIAPDFTYYLTEKTTYVKVSMWEINANGHYYFLDKDAFKVFGLGGVNYAQSSVKFDHPLGGMLGVSGTSASEGKIGLNLGGGATYDLSESIQAFSTLKYSLGSTDQLVLYAGARYIF